MSLREGQSISAISRKAESTISRFYFYPALSPEDYFAGRKEVRLAERKEKLHTADINRKAYWLQQQHS